MRPMLKPALSRAWRDQETLQFGTTPERARLVPRADERYCAFLGLLDGERDAPELAAAGEGLGLAPGYVAEALRSLEAAGLLEDARAVEQELAALPPSRRELLGPDLASLSLLHPEPGGGARVLARRTERRVEVRGAGRVGAALAAVLAAGGVGRVEVVDQGRVRLADCAPGGMPAREAGRLRSSAARAAVRRAAGLPGDPPAAVSGVPGPAADAAGRRDGTAGRPVAPAAAVSDAAGRSTAAGPASPAPAPPACATRAPAHGGRPTATRRERTRTPAADPPEQTAEERPPDLVVLAPRNGSGAFAGDAAEAQQLMRAGIPHLYVGVVEHLGVVGPLVLPGASACGRCVSLTRTDQDSAWPRLLAQLAADGPAGPPEPACDGAVATVLAGLAGLHALLLLDGERPPSVDGWCEVSAADGMVRRLRLSPHTECGCFWR